MSDVTAGPWASQIYSTSLLGPIFVGQAAAVPLYGLFLGRFWGHVTDEELWREHSRRYRAFLYTITGLVTVYTLLIMEESCYYGTLQQRSAEKMLRGHPVRATIPPLGGLILALVSATLAYRASHLFSSRLSKWIFLGGIGVLIGASFAGSLLVTYSAVRHLRNVQDAATSFTFNNSISLWMATSAAADVSISVALWINLRRQVGAGFEVTDSILRTLTRVGVRTAGYTSIVAIIAAGLSAFPEPDYRTTGAVYAAFLPLPCLSCLSLFTTLQSQRTPARSESIPCLGEGGAGSEAGSRGKRGRGLGGGGGACAEKEQRPVACVEGYLQRLRRMRRDSYFPYFWAGRFSSFFSGESSSRLGRRTRALTRSTVNYRLCLSMFYDYLQSEIYVRHSKKMKASLWGTVALLCLVSILTAEELCYYGVWQQRTGAAILSAHWPSGMEALLTELVCASVQILLTFRAANFFPRNWLRAAFLILNSLLVLASVFGASVATSVGYLYYTNSTEKALPFTYSNATLIWLISAAACDCSISLGLWINVRRRIADAGVAGWAFKSVVKTSLQTAAYTAFFAVGGAVAAIISITENQSYSTIDAPFAFWTPLPSISVLSLFIVLSSNREVGKRLAQKNTSMNTGFQPGQAISSRLDLSSASSRSTHSAHRRGGAGMADEGLPPQALATALVGPLYFGWTLQVFTAGIFFSSLAAYHEYWATHSKGVRTALGVVTTLLFIQTAFNFAEIFWWGVRVGMNVNDMLVGHWPMTTTPLVIGLIGATAQIFLTQRAAQLFVKRWTRWLFYIVQGLLIITAFMGSCMVTYFGFLYLFGLEDQQGALTFNRGVAIWLIANAVADTLISVTLFFNLRARAKAAGGFNPQTFKLLSTLIRTGLEVALYTTIVSIGGAAVSIAFAEADLYTTDVPFAFFLPMSSLYALSLLTTLSTRTKMSRQLSKGNLTGVMTSTAPGSPFDVPLPQINGRRISLAPSTHAKNSSPLRIHVTTQQEVEYDDALDEEDEEEEQRRSMRLKRLRNLSLV
ncbi:hypothetical protein BCR35DRAFT_325200 [Leucosporidium creatinivorum]|uniref:DUF6534 domain-containing protein n=1 Tax=Leucosporidium creatinivorum TaxID=106004 RepID=A0A1Y2FBJ4_9BASI|nr:hypothetical protein BCR35DRAFT_325200 [Leucosporidium creatinivorum]